MPAFPASPISPQEFFEQFVPKAFAEAKHPEGLGELDLTLGVRLEGDGGGEWVYHLRDGALSMQAGPRDEAAFTVVQSVDDWRGALWEDRGGIIGKQAAALFRPGEAQAARPGGLGGPPNPAALAQLKNLKGVIRMVVAGGPGGDRSVAFQLGPGEIPAEPTTTVTLSADDAAAMERGELDPMQAFMAGRIQIAGDMTLMMQMQAIQMQAAAQPQPKPEG